MPEEVYRPTMAGYYFHLRNDLDVPDDEGKELANLQAARAHAVVMARFEVAEAAKLDGRILLSHRIDIEDEQGNVLSSVSFDEAVSVSS
jgi:hypothetical protein